MGTTDKNIEDAIVIGEYNLEQMEIETIKKAIARYYFVGGYKMVASKLGITERTFYNKKKKYKL